MSNTKLVNLPVAKIIPWEHNPKRRIDHKLRAELRKLIESGRAITPLTVVATGNRKGEVIIADGHGRYHEGCALGVSHFDCVEYPIGTDVAQLWMDLNGSTAKITSNDMFSVWLDTGVKPTSSRQMAYFLRCVEIFEGKANVRRLMVDGPRAVAPFIVELIDKAHDHLVNHGPRGKPTPTPKTIGLWMIKHGQQDAVSRTMKDTAETPSKKYRNLYNAIKGDRPLAQNARLRLVGKAA